MGSFVNIESKLIIRVVGEKIHIYRIQKRLRKIQFTNVLKITIKYNFYEHENHIIFNSFLKKRRDLHSAFYKYKNLIITVRILLFT